MKNIWQKKKAFSLLPGLSPVRVKSSAQEPAEDSFSCTCFFFFFFKLPVLFCTVRNCSPALCDSEMGHRYQHVALLLGQWLFCLSWICSLQICTFFFFSFRERDNLFLVLLCVIIYLFFLLKPSKIKFIFISLCFRLGGDTIRQSNTGRHLWNHAICGDGGAVERYPSDFFFSFV